MCKRFFSIIALLCCFVAICSAELRVYNIIGKAQYKKSGKWQLISVGQSMSKSDVILTSENGCLEILDSENKKIYSLQSSEPAELSKLIKKSESGKVIAFFSALWAAVVDDKDIIDKTYTEAGVVYRADELADKIADALMLKHFPKDYVSDYDIDFIENGSVIEIHNGSDKTLFFNIYKIIKAGNHYLLQPIDIANNRLLLIPAKSSITLECELDKSMRFTLLASEDVLPDSDIELPSKATNFMEPLKLGVFVKQ